MQAITWSIKDIAKIINGRQENEYDANLAVCGDRGDGKSTVLSKILYRFEQFNPWKHQVYNRDDVINLLTTQKKGICFDDEAINSGYKREFMTKGQQNLIKILTAYRDNFNIFGSALPNFFTLDKDLRELYFILLHVIERGTAVVHMPLQGRLYSQDRWDAKNNARIEESWSKKISKDPTFKIPYHKLSTFRGYLFFEKLTPNQENLYKKVKKTKRAQSFEDVDPKKEPPFLDKLYAQLIQHKLTKEGLTQSCWIEGKKYSSILAQLNQRLRDAGEAKTVRDFLGKGVHSKINDQIKSLIPNF